MLSNEVISVVNENHFLYISTKKGITKLSEPINTESKPSPIIFQYARLNNDKLYYPDQILEIPSKYEYLTLNYVSLNYKSNGDINYKYKIEGIHDNWVETKDRKVQFTFLPTGGDYLFQIKAQNENGIWSPTKTLKLKFLIPFYKTLWFYIIVLHHNTFYNLENLKVYVL